jgi:hypothetical protein
MKISILGMTIFEIQRDRPAPRTKPPVPPPESPKTRWPLSALEAPARILPRTSKGTVDVQASLQMFGLGDGVLLWQRRYTDGSAGAALKRIIATQRLIPDPPAADPTKPDLRTFPAKDLPRTLGSNLPDLGASLALFGIKDPAILWTRRYRPESAGGRLKMLIRREGAGKSAAREQQVRAPAPVATSQSQPTLILDRQGQIDINASLTALGIDDPKTLWTAPIQAGSPHHILKKEIAKALLRGQTIPNITRDDTGLSC